MRTETEIVEALLSGLRPGNRDDALLAPDVVFDGAPRCERKLIGAEVGEALASLSSLVSGIRIERHIVEGPYVATMLALDTVLGPLCVSAWFRLSNGLIKEIHAFYSATGGKP